jgi:hypothetical protein
VLILAMPLALESPTINTLNVWWQGRLWLPVAVGFPLVASTFQWRPRQLWGRRTERQWAVPAVVLGVGLVLCAAQIASFTRALGRYEVGLGVQPGSRTLWLPPGGDAPVIVAFVIGAIVTLALVVFMTFPRMDVDSTRARESGGPGDLQPLSIPDHI